MTPSITAWPPTMRSRSFVLIVRKSSIVNIESWLETLTPAVVLAAGALMHEKRPTKPRRRPSFCDANVVFAKTYLFSSTKFTVSPQLQSSCRNAC